MQTTQATVVTDNVITSAIKPSIHYKQIFSVESYTCAVHILLLNFSKIKKMIVCICFNMKIETQSDHNCLI